MDDEKISKTYECFYCGHSHPGVEDELPEGWSSFVEENREEYACDGCSHSMEKFEQSE